MLTILRTAILSLIILYATAETSAEWRIDIESKTVLAGETGVTVDVTAYWDVSLINFIVPVLVREVDPGAFWTGTLPYDTSGTASNHPHAHGVTWNWAVPWAILAEEFSPAPLLADPPNPCDPATDQSYDAISPDQFAIIAAGVIVAEPPQPNGRVVLTFAFDVTTTAGDFEFDTLCMNQSLTTILMIDNQFPPVDYGPMGTGQVVFNKGIITLEGGDGDTDQDGIIDREDNCRFIFNPDQLDTDLDEVGDSCDACPGFNDNIDPDRDDWPNGCDNCPETVNQDQNDLDDDGYGDACDNCVEIYNIDQADADRDDVGDVCDVCSGFDDKANQDSDSHPDGCDNCPSVTNEDQEDYDDDGLGNACDPCDCTSFGDVNLDGIINPMDVAIMVYYVYRDMDSRLQLTTNCPRENGDWNCSGQIHPVDVVWYVNYVYRNIGEGPCEPCL